MKQFFKYVLATVVGLLVFGIIVAIFGTMSIVGMVASGEATKNVSKNSVMVINMNSIVDEQSQPDIVSKLTGGGIETIGLDELLSAIKKAKTNDNIKGIYMEGGLIEMGLASAQEVRAALEDFRESGKWIVSYADVYSQGSYYLASVADKVIVNPKGMVDIHGIGSQPMFVKDLMKKFGVKMQVIKVGQYKSATEMFTEDKMSAANRQQVEAYVKGIWDNMVASISKSRDITPEQLNLLADSVTMMMPTEALLGAKLVDTLLYADGVKGVVKDLLGIDEKKTINQVSLEEMKGVKGPRKDGEEIAVYYAFGDIVQNGATGIGQQGHEIAAATVCKDIEKLAADDNVKAVVIRVNSGGGDAYASEQLWHAITELKAKKPVVVSMGDYAASGGYYMSCPASWIVAQPNTLTGSIGIFGMIPDASELVTQKLGVRFDEVKTNRHSTLGGGYSRPLNNEEIGMLQKEIGRGYELFRQRVADGRGLTIEEVENIAQGHVWLGQDALDIKLVDQLGGLDDAVAKAAELAELKEYYTSSYPAAPGILDQIFGAASKGTNLDEQMRAVMGDLYEPYIMLKNINRRQMMQARMPFILNVR
ncbi:MAG: signal peptide peptidase SppA [Prevotella sp.]|nr:signal peptide peptidase SppA [Prevotella sp.]